MLLKVRMAQIQSSDAINGILSGQKDRAKLFASGIDMTLHF